MDFKIVSDSSSNVFSLDGVGYANVPLKIIAGTQEYVDTPDLDLAGMVSDLQNYKGKSGSSCPNVQEWLDTFGDADNVFGVTISSNLSGSYAAAQNAAAEFEAENPGKHAFIVDSLSAGPEMALIADKLREFIRAGLPFEKIREKIQSYQAHTHTLFSLQSMTNLARNGRVNPAVAKVAGVLGIRVVGEAREGRLHALHKPRGEKKALEILFAEMKKKGLFEGAKVRISHCFNPEAAQALKEMILKAFPTANVIIEHCAALCSYYAEAGGLIIGYEGA